ncbi:hypothetical protein [Nonomuraea maheshkhaliensis]
MNRVVKTAMAVTAFGLAAAAMAVPAQAEVQYSIARYAPIDSQGAGTAAAGSPLGGLLSGLAGKGLLGGLLDGLKAKSAAKPASQMTEAELDAAAENQAEQGISANGFEDVTQDGGPLPELSPIVGGFPLTTGSSLTGSLPVLSGAARMAQPATPSVKAGKQGRGEAATTGTSTQSAINGLLGSPTGGAVTQLHTTSLLPASDSGNVMAGTAKGFQSLSADLVLGGVGQAAQRALPNAASGGLAPMIGHVAPGEMAPVVEALPATSQAAAMDDLAPLVEEGASFAQARGTRAAGSYSDVITALGWTTDALTSSVRDRWVRD